jgi:alpha-tubulin suppressor-like RCC1 family protein
MSVNYTAALLSNGKVMAWGLAQLVPITRDGVDLHTSPVEIRGVDGATQIGVGIDMACALDANGAVTCWGRDWAAWRASRPGTEMRTEVQSFARELGVMDRHGCARLGRGDVTCFGTDDSGSGGIGTSQQIAVAGDRVCGVRADLTVECVGLKLGREWEYWPREGYEPYATRIPLVAKGLTGVRSLRGSSSHLCAIVDGGEVKCLGFCDEGELGDGVWGRPCVEIAAVTAKGLADVQEIAVGGEFTCARTADKSVYCWGVNASGELGLGGAQRRTTPTKVEGLDGVVHIAAGPSHACALREDGAVLCWGYNTYGQLGTGDRVERRTPARVVGLPQP